MKSDKKLLEVFNKAKGEHLYYSFNDFKMNAKQFLKDVKDRSTYCHIDVSRSGMSRKFNFDKYNMLLNICYNQKFSWNPVSVGGCGMDMHWHVKFTACEYLFTEKENEKYQLNYKCSSGRTL
jgi:hypothetical protein